MDDDDYNLEDAYDDETESLALDGEFGLEELRALIEWLENRICGG